MWLVVKNPVELVAINVDAVATVYLTSDGKYRFYISVPGSGSVVGTIEYRGSTFDDAEEYLRRHADE
jgi:hypothetical protein